MSGLTIHRARPAIKSNEFHKTKRIIESMEHAKNTNGRLHLLGLVSDGGVHSHIGHLFALLKMAKEIGVPHVYIHFFGDGRDTAPRSATIYAKQLLDFIKENGVGELATIVGRYYAMDRDKRWERVKVAVDGLVSGVGEKSDDPIKTIEENYAKDVTDEFLKPIICGGPDSRIQSRSDRRFFLLPMIWLTSLPLVGGDTLFTFNYRSDRVREIVSVLGLPDKPMEVTVPENLVRLFFFTSEGST